jgi:cyclase
MLKKRIIPCLDIKNGRVVKGVNFENLIDAGDAVAQAKYYSSQGADELCFLDISASNENRSIIIETVKKVAEVCFIPLTVGGGISSLDDFSMLLNSGADKISINSSAVKNPDLITKAAKRFGSQCVVVAIDAKKENQEYRVFTHGGRNITSLNAVDWAKNVEELGAGEILLTSMDKDGTKSGYDLDLISQITNAVKIPVIASGGVGELNHLSEGIKAGASAVLAASIFHFKKHTILEAKNFLEKQKIPVRI